MNTEKELEIEYNNLNMITHKKKNSLDITNDDNIKNKEEKKEELELLNINTKYNHQSKNFNKIINSNRSLIGNNFSVNQYNNNNNTETNRIFFVTPIKTEIIKKKKMKKIMQN